MLSHLHLYLAITSAVWHHGVVGPVIWASQHLFLPLWHYVCCACALQVTLGVQLVAVCRETLLSWT